jgi:cystathionine beta-lyase
MSTNFDEIIDRGGTNSSKWEFRVQDGVIGHWDRTRAELGDDRVIPMWVADMDFRAPEAVIAAVCKRAEHGIYGYSRPTRSYYDAVAGWMHDRHGWAIQTEWIVTTPGIVSALHLIVRRFTRRGEKVLIQPPVYHPFTYAIETNQRVVAANPLKLTDGRYYMDLDHLEAVASDPQVRLAILCSPHNPGGRLWSTHELDAFAEICARHDVLVVADEIHGDLVLPGHQFTAYGTVRDIGRDRCIVCTAPSKTFNLAGMQASNVIIADPELREALYQETRATGLYTINPFGIVACEAAYREGGPWLDEMLAYVGANVEFLEDYLARHLPAVQVMQPEATYLVWMDFRAVGLGVKRLGDRMMEGARLYLDEGCIFGTPGDGFMRINVACPRSVLAEALERMCRAFQ